MTSSSRWLGIMIRVSTLSRSSAVPDLRLRHADTALEHERLGDDGHGERTEFAGDAGHDRRGAGAGAAAHAGGDEHHVAAVEGVGQRRLVLLDRLATDDRISAGAEPAGDLRADLQSLMGKRLAQGLGIGVDGQEFDAGEPRLDHAVDGIAARPADPNDLDPGYLVDLFNELEHDDRPLIHEPGVRDLQAGRHP